jgi:hypothetical protein
MIRIIVIKIWKIQYETQKGLARYLQGENVNIFRLTKKSTTVVGYEYPGW